MAANTKAGDGGFTRLPGQNDAMVRKDDVRCAALGTLDELNAAVGLCLAEAGRAGNDRVGGILSPIQGELLAVGSVLGAVCTDTKPPLELDPSATRRLEEDIDRIGGQLPELTHFILPGGCELGARLHAARTLARRAERAVVAAIGHEGNRKLAEPAAAILAYLNRLSDLLFALARLANRDAGVDAVWRA